MTGEIVQFHLAVQAMEFVIWTHGDMIGDGKLIHKPFTGIMPCVLIFFAGIGETNYELDS